MSTQPNDGGAAFPHTTEQTSQRYNGVMEAERGMTLRDFFIAHAPPMPQGWRKGIEYNESATRGAQIEAAWRADYADAQLAERAKHEKG